MSPQDARSALRALPDVESHVEAVLRAYGPLTQAQAAAKVYGVPVHATGNRADDRARTSAIRAVQQETFAFWRSRSGTRAARASR